MILHILNAAAPAIVKAAPIVKTPAIKPPRGVPSISLMDSTIVVNPFNKGTSQGSIALAKVTIKFCQTDTKASLAPARVLIRSSIILLEAPVELLLISCNSFL